MTDPRTLAEEVKEWASHNICRLAQHESRRLYALAGALITALEDAEEQRGNAEGFWGDRERFREENEALGKQYSDEIETVRRLVEENERLRAQMDAAINLLNAEVSRLRHEYGVALQVLLDHGVIPGEFEQALAETPEREG